MGSWVDNIYDGIYGPPASAVAPPSGGTNRGVTINTPTGRVDTSFEDMMIEAGVGPGVNPRNAYAGAQKYMRDALIANNSRLPGGEKQKRIRLPSGEYVVVNAANQPKVDPATPFTGSKNPALMASLLASIIPGYNVKPGTTRNPIQDVASPGMPVGAPELNAPGFDPWAGMRTDSQPGPANVPGVSLGSIRMGNGGGSGGGGGGGGATGMSMGSPVRTATGKATTVGHTYQQGSNGQGQKYTYQVQKDGSIKNTTTGRITAPAGSIR